MQSQNRQLTPPCRVAHSTPRPPSSHDAADTGNSCKHQGYAEFNPTSWPSDCAPAKEDWINEVVGQCGEGDRYPEEFWNCADVEITSGEQVEIRQKQQ